MAEILQNKVGKRNFQQQSETRNKKRRKTKEREEQNLLARMKEQEHSH